MHSDSEHVGNNQHCVHVCVLYGPSPSACRVGLDVLLGSGVLGCHTDMWQEKFGSELRAASVLMEAGYSIDCLMVRWGSWSDLANDGVQSLSD